MKAHLMKHLFALSTCMALTLISANGMEVEQFVQQLSPHGKWINHPTHGQCWRPSIAKSKGWRPYTVGNWIHTNHGWTWNSSEPFGNITYHYGRWANDPDAGWLWVAGSQWAPSWVAWRYGTEFIGWAPLPPKSLESPNQSWGSNVETLLSIAPNDYSFVQTKDFSNFTPSDLVPRDENLHCIYQTQNVTQTRVGKTDVLAGGPSLNELNQILEIDLPTYQLDKTQSIQRAKVIASSPSFADTPAESKPKQLTDLKPLGELKQELSAMREEQAEVTHQTRITVYSGPPIIYYPNHCDTSRQRSVIHSRYYTSPTIICRPNYRHRHHNRCEPTPIRKNFVIR